MSIDYRLDRFPDEYVGLGRYLRREVIIPDVKWALSNLYERQWHCDVLLTCECGHRFHAGSGIRCGTCRRDCKHEPTHGYIIQGDGRYAPKAYCCWCGQNCPGPFGYPNPDPKRRQERWLFDFCFKDIRHDQTPEPCERCGSSEGTQLHHWAPTAIFADADDWPTGWLCPRCHAAWHQAMRAARGHRLPSDQLAAVGLTFEERTRQLDVGDEVSR
jgi:hypothetical protein